MRKLKNEIIKGLKEHMGINVVPTDTADRKPDYPYMSYKITTPLESAKSFSLVDNRIPSETPGYDYDVEVVRKEQNHFTMSVSSYSMDADEALTNAVRAADWFNYVSYFYLKSLNAVVVSVSNIGDRTTQIVDDYERRYGFDVRLRSARGVVKRLEPIEAHDLHGTIKK